MQDKYEDLYTIAVMRYKEENPNINSDDLFPLKWHMNKDYKLKTMILAEAIKNHVLIADTDLYRANFVDDVVRIRND